MNKLFKSLLCLALLVATLGATDKDKKAAAASGLPPIIDRELIFGNPEIAGPQLSPDGKYLAFLKPWKDTRNVYVKGVDEPFSAARLLTTEAKRPIAGYFWTRDSKYILFVKDNDGDENFNVYAVDPAAKPAAGADAPASRDMTGLKGVRVQLAAELLRGRSTRRHITFPVRGGQPVRAGGDVLVFLGQLGDHLDVAAAAVTAHRYQPLRRGREPTGSPGRAASRDR